MNNRKRVGDRTTMKNITVYRFRKRTVTVHYSRTVRKETGEEGIERKIEFVRG